MTTLTYPHKQGATFSLSGTVLLPAGTWSAICRVRDRGGALVASPAVDLQVLAQPSATASHSIVIEDPSTSAVWPAAKLLCDIRFTDASVPPVVVPSDTFVIDVAARISDA